MLEVLKVEFPPLFPFPAETPSPPAPTITVYEAPGITVIVP
jgi:hypothetical protein